MADADVAAGIHTGVSGVPERDHRNAFCDSQPRSNYAEPNRQERGGSQQGIGDARAGAARRGPHLQRHSAECRGAPKPSAGNADEDRAAGARGAEPGETTTDDSESCAKLDSHVTNLSSAPPVA